MKVVLTTLNAKYIHKNLALRWLYVARPKNMDAEIKEFTIKEQEEAIVASLLACKADAIVFSIYIWNLEKTLRIINRIKAVCDTPILIGGPEVSFSSFSLLEEGVDAISLGEGEHSVWQYMQMLEAKKQYEIAGIYTKKHPNRQYQKVDLAYHETLENPYFLEMDQKDMGKRYLYLETSRGCPYSCTYCLSSTDNRVRMFSEEYIFSILKQLADSNVRIVKLLDRTFNVMPQRALRLARYMNTYCKNQIFQFEVVAETLSEEMLTFFCEEADTSRFRLEIGVQSFHDKTLEAVGRMQNNARLMEVITRLQKAGVTMHVDLIAGLPYEDIECFQKSFNTLFALHTSEIQLGILKLLKGTKLKAQQEEYGFVYESHTPYEVKATNWLNEAEMEGIHRCAHAVEKYYNSGRLRTTIDTVLELGLWEDAFSLFYELGEKMTTLSHPYAPHELFLLLKEVLQDKEERIVNGLLYYDYFKLFKQRPKRFLTNTISMEEREQVKEYFLETGIVSKEQFYHYAHVDCVYYNKQVGYQIVLYDKQQNLPRRWFCDGKKVEEMR